MKSSYRLSANFIQEIFSVLCVGSLYSLRFEYLNIPPLLPPHLVRAHSGMHYLCIQKFYQLS